MRIPQTLWMISFVIAGAASVWGQQYTPPLYLAGRTMDEIRVDGKLDEFTWMALPRAGRFKNIRQPEGGDALPTEAALTWDDSNLYAAFACYDPEPWGTLMKRDQHLWNEEVVEIFLDPDGDGKKYAELEVSPNNIVVDLLIPAVPNHSTDASVAARWDIKGLKTAVGKYSSGWVVEIAIPWASLGEAGATTAPRQGDRWRVGLYRIERAGGPKEMARINEIEKKLKSAPKDAQAALRKDLESWDEKAQALAWSPTRKSFHDPERFGVVEFVLRP